MGCPSNRSLLRLLAIPFCAGALVGQQKAIDRAVADLSSPVAAVQLKAMRELLRSGAAAVPALRARLTEVVGTGWEATSHAQPFFLHDDEDDLYCSIDEVALFWPEPLQHTFLDLEPAKVVLDDRERRATDYLGDEPLAVAHRLLFLLSLCGERAAPLVPQLVELLAHETLAAEAGQVLVGVGAPAVPALLTALTDRRRVYAAAQTLAWVQRDRPPALVRDALVDLLQNGRRSARDGALVALAHMRGVADAAAARAVAEPLRTASGTTLRYAIWAIGGMGRHGAAELRPLLGEDLQPARLGLLLGAVQLLGEDARGLAGEVLAAAANGAAPTQVANALAVAGPGSPQEAQAFEFVLQLARDGTLVEQAAGARALGAFGRFAARSAPVLTRLLDEGYLLRYVALDALTALGPAAVGARDGVLAIATQARPRMDAVTLGTLRSLGAIDFEASEVRARIDQYDLALRQRAVRALGAVDAQSAPRLLQWLGEEQVAGSAVDGLVAIGPSVVPQLAESLGDASRGDGAAYALARVGGKGVEVLLDRMADADPDIAGRVQQALSWGDNSVAQRLLALLRDGKERERDAAAGILANRDLSELKRTQADALIAAAQAAPARRRADLVSALETVQQDRVTAFLVRCVSDDDGEVRLRAVSGLGWYHDLERDDVGKALRRALVDPVPSVRQAAAEAAGRTPGGDAAMAELLQRMAGAPLADERAPALRALGVFGGVASTSLPLLVASLGDPSAAVRAAALRGLGSLGSLAQTQQDAIVLALRDADEDVRFEARSALEAVRPDLATAIQRLREHKEASQWNSAVGLGGVARTGPAPKVDDVRAMLAADDVERIVHGLELMRQYQQKLTELRPALLPLLGHPEAKVRIDSANTLVQFGAEAALGDVLPMLRDPDPSVRIGVLRILQYKSDVAAKVIDAVAGCAADRDPTVRVAAFWALQALTYGNRAFLGRLEALARTAANDLDVRVRIRAFAACSHFKPLEPATIQVLGQALGDEGSGVAEAAAGALAGAGDSGLPFVPKLLELGRKGDRALAAACLSALGSIAPARADVMWLALDHLKEAGADATDLAPALSILGK